MPSNGLMLLRQTRIGCACKVSLQSEFSYVFSNCLPELWNSHTGYICLISLTMCFEMFPQIACIGRCILALVAFKGFFPGMSFQMSPQISCLSRCKVTLIALVGLFSCLLCHVNFQDFEKVLMLVTTLNC